jgi:hypothetical protein
MPERNWPSWSTELRTSAAEIERVVKTSASTKYDQYLSRAGSSCLSLGQSLVWPPPEHFWIGRKRGNSCRLSNASLMTNARARTPAEILTPGPELRIPGTAAQTRMVSAGAFWPSRGGLSRHLKYMTRARISEFESSHPSQPVRSLWTMSGLQK